MPPDFFNFSPPAVQRFNVEIDTRKNEDHMQLLRNSSKFVAEIVLKRNGFLADQISEHGKSKKFQIQNKAII